MPKNANLQLVDFFEFPVSLSPYGGEGDFKEKPNKTYSARFPSASLLGILRCCGFCTAGVVG